MALNHSLHWKSSLLSTHPDHVTSFVPFISMYIIYRHRLIYCISFLLGSDFFSHCEIHKYLLSEWVPSKFIQGIIYLYLDQYYFELSVRLYSLRKIVRHLISNQERLTESVSKDNRKQKYRWNKMKIYVGLMTAEVK